MKILLQIYAKVVTLSARHALQAPPLHVSLVFLENYYRLTNV